MITDKPCLARMDNADIRTAYIDLRVAELRVLAAKTAVEFWREQRQRGLASLQLRGGTLIDCEARKPGKKRGRCVQDRVFGPALEFVAHNSRLRFGSLNHASADAINPKRPIAADAHTLIYFRFQGHSRHGGPADGFVSVENDPTRTSTDLTDG
jgi:hypothetical protein